MLLAAGTGCGLRTHPVPPGFSADTATRTGLASGATASAEACHGLTDAVWVRAGDRRECLRVEAASLEQAPGRTAMVFIGGDAAGAAYRFAGGRVQVEAVEAGYETASAAMRRTAAAALSRAERGVPVILMARPGMRGSSGIHAQDRHSMAELELVDDGLTWLRDRHGFRDFALYGFSSGGVIVANLLARRADVRCAVIASAPLDIAGFYREADGTASDLWTMRRASLADPMRSVAALDPAARAVVLGDPRDRTVPPALWQPWVDAARRAGLAVEFELVREPEEPGPRSMSRHHVPSLRGLDLLRSCVADAAPDGIASSDPALRVLLD
jgi:pimeloyl-ACP methyl ester carboxylesterase